jgi:hypothetical protein
LVWETDKNVPEKDMAIDQQPASAFQGQKLLLDGQQRLTSLYAIVRGQALRVRNKLKPIDIAFNVAHPEGPPSEASEVEDDQPQQMDDSDNGSEPGEDLKESVMKARLRRRTFVVASKSILSDPTWIKVSDIFKEGRSDWDLLKPLGFKNPDDANYDVYSKRLQKVRAIRSYQYVMQVLERGLTYEEVAEIFVRVNSLGMKLRGSDLALAQITARWPHSLELFEAFAEEMESVWTFDLGLLVRTMVVLATHQSRFRTVGTIPIERLEAAWKPTKEGLRFAVNFLRSNAGIEDESLLSYPFLVIPIAVYSVLRENKITQEAERDLLHWFFLANAHGHYSGSSETVLDADLSVLFKGEDPSKLLEALKQQVGRLRFEAGDFARRGSQNPLFQTTYLAVRHLGAKDWSSGLRISLSHSGKNHYIEAHHIFPKALLKQAGFEQDQINEIANMAFLSGSKNKALGKKAPEVYLPQVLAQRGEEALTAQGIPMEDELWKIEGYNSFLEARRKELASIVNEFLEQVASEGGAATFDVGALIASGENELVEFKETARYNAHTHQPDPKLETAALRSIAGFLNGQGGTLLIGVNDAGVLQGLDRDFKTYPKHPNADGFQQFLRQLMKDGIGPNASSNVDITFPTVDGVQVSAVRVSPSPTAVYTIVNGQQEFFVRLGNTTQALTMKDAHDYIQQHFK